MPSPFGGFNARTTSPQVARRGVTVCCPRLLRFWSILKPSPGGRFDSGWREGNLRNGVRVPRFLSMRDENTKNKDRPRALPDVTPFRPVYVLVFSRCSAISTLISDCLGTPRRFASLSND